MQWRTDFDDTKTQGMDARGRMRVFSGFPARCRNGKRRFTPLFLLPVFQSPTRIAPPMYHQNDICHLKVTPR
jgi:hypothetical protein